MMHLFINAFAASAGGGLTYIRNVVPGLGARAGVRATVLVSPDVRPELGNWANIKFLETPALSGAGNRFWYEQRELPGLIRRSGAQVLLSTGNFALWRSPVPQILLSRNSLYTSPDYFRDLQHRRDYGRWLDTKIKGRIAAASISRAEITVAPSASFAADLRGWVGPRYADRIICIHHGFDAGAFHDSDPAPPELAAQLANPHGALRLLFVSNYTYYRNFETLLRALPLIQAQTHSRRVELVLTCKLDASPNPGSYRTDDTAILRDELELGSTLIELGAVPYQLLHHVYRACDVYLTPAYTETFAHPLVEAMSSALPIVASDLAVHREICGNAASYFPRFSAESLAAEVLKLEENNELRAAMSQAGLARSREFSWERHVADLLAVAGKIGAH